MGDSVLIRERKTGKLMTPFNPKPYKVIKTKGTMITVQRGKHTATRNISHLKPLKQCTSIPHANSTDDEMDDFDDIAQPQEHRPPRNSPEHPVQMERRYPKRNYIKKPP